MLYISHSASCHWVSGLSQGSHLPLCQAGGTVLIGFKVSSGLQHRSLQPWVEVQTKWAPSLALKRCFFSSFPLAFRSCKWSCQERCREVLSGHRPTTRSGDVFHDCSVIVKPGGFCGAKPQRRCFTLLSCRGCLRAASGDGWQCGSSNNLIYSHNAFVLIKTLFLPSPLM